MKIIAPIAFALTSATALAASTSIGVQTAASKAPAAARSLPKPALMSAAECEVWNRELSFAKTVEAHDAVAFAEHVHRDTVFNAGSAAPMRGRTAVVEDWKEIIDGEKFALRWRPGFVSIGGDPNIALSSGPAWTEDFDPQTKQRYTISRFTSTWVKDSDGQWRVLFDGSGAPRRPASADEVRALIAAVPAACPRG